MKVNNLLFLVCLVFVVNTNAQIQSVRIDSVESVCESTKTFRYKNFYLGGQPTLKSLQWLKSQKVTKIINLRTENENTKHTKQAFNEREAALKLGFQYETLFVGGMKDHTTAKLESFIKLIDKDKKVLIHCLSGGRVRNFFMAYLIKNEGYSVDEAIDVGKQLNYSIPLEHLLGEKISMRIE